MIIPVIPDNEVFEYLPTQVIADFLSSKRDLNLTLSKIIHRYPKAKPINEIFKSLWKHFDKNSNTTQYRHPATLDIDQRSIIIHAIEGVAFQTVTQKVKRIKTAIAKPNPYTNQKLMIFDRFRWSTINKISLVS